MLRHASIALLASLASTIAPAQSGWRISGAPQVSGAMQRRGGFPISSRQRSLIGLSGTPLHDLARRQGVGRSPFFYGWPAWSPGYYEDSYEPEAAQQPVPPTRASVGESSPAPVPSAVLLELQGNQWVKVSGFATVNPAATAPAVHKELPPSVIVFRDGHREELTSYSIIGATLYAKSDYLTTGAWTRKVLLADLDLPATIKQNQERGLKFDLPSGPNEVVLRP